MNRQTAPIGIRLPVDLKEWLKGQAEQSRRSVNSQVIILLEQSRQQLVGRKESQQ